MQQPAQIFDLLLGNINPVQSNENPKGFAGAESDGLVFGDLLLDLADHAGIVANEEQAQTLEGFLLRDGTIEGNTPQNEIISSLIENRNHEAAVVKDSEPAASSPFHSRGVPVQLVTGSHNVSGTSISQQPVADNVAEFNNRLHNEQGLDFSLPKSGLNDLTYREAIDIKPGKYEILNQTIENSRITLTVKSANSEDAPIKLSLPMELFETGKVVNRADGVTQRSALDSGFDRALQLQILFDKLNLKGIEVKALAEPAVGSSGKIITEAEGKTLDIKLIAQESEKIMPVLRPVTKTELKASRESVRTPAITGKENSEQTVALESDSRIEQTTRSTTKAEMSERAAALISRSAIPKQSKEIFDQMTKGDTVLEQQRTSFDPIVADRTQADLAVDDQKSEPRPIRFVMPDNLKTMLKPNGNSVMIKIDPEHLGPARLNLSMHNNVLKARIVVENIHVRSMVEASLDHLVDQLSKADIKVDQIEVSLSGNGFRDNFGSRRNFRHSSKSSQLRDSKIGNLEKIAAASPVHVAAGQYVGSQGVNILA